MKDEFSITVGWLEQLHGPPAERETFGEVEFRCNGIPLTELEDLGAATVRRAARLSVWHLGAWLAANWWRLRWEPLPPYPDVDWRLAHQLGAAGGGFAWPALQFAADGETVAVSMHDTLECGGPVRYLRRVETSIGAATFERAVDELMSLLLQRLTLRHVDAGDVATAWNEVLAERREPGAADARRREALLGLDPDAAPAEELAATVSSGMWMGVGALEETMAAARAAGVRAALAQLKNLSMETSAELDLSGLVGVEQAWRAAPRRFHEPWERGVALAELVRKEVGLSPDEPVPSSKLADILSHDVTADRSAEGLSLAAGFRLPGTTHRTRFFGVRRHSNSRRFEAARFLADFLDGPARDVVFPITDAATARQKVQRSFAQQFLCPIEALAQFVRLPAPSDLELETAADHFGVSDFTVRSALVNRGLVDRSFLPGYATHGSGPAVCQ